MKPYKLSLTTHDGELLGTWEVGELLDYLEGGAAYDNTYDLGYQVNRDMLTDEIRREVRKAQRLDSVDLPKCAVCGSRLVSDRDSVCDRCFGNEQYQKMAELDQSELVRSLEQVGFTVFELGGDVPCSICGMTADSHNDETCRREYED